MRKELTARKEALRVEVALQSQEAASLQTYIVSCKDYGERGRKALAMVAVRIHEGQTGTAGLKASLDEAKKTGEEVKSSEWD